MTSACAWISARYSHKLSQRSNMTQRLSSRYPLQDMDNCLFLFISDLVVLYRHKETCQFVAFIDSNFYRRILSTCGRRVASQFAAFIINPICFLSEWLPLKRAQSWFNPVVYYMKFQMVPLYLRSKYCFSLLALSVFQTNSSVYMMFIFIITFSFEQLPNHDFMDYINHGWIRIVEHIYAHFSLGRNMVDCQS